MNHKLSIFVTYKYFTNQLVKHINQNLWTIEIYILMFTVEIISIKFKKYYAWNGQPLLKLLISTQINWFYLRYFDDLFINLNFSNIK